MAISQEANARKQTPVSRHVPDVSVEAILELVDNAYCDPDRVYLTFKLYYLNGGSRNIILHRTPPLLMGETIRRVELDGQTSAYSEKNVNAYHHIGTGYRGETAKVDSKYFLILKPGERLLAQGFTELLQPAPRDGDYTFRRRLMVNHFPIEDIRVLQKNWQTEGVIWIAGHYTNSVPFKIDRSKKADPSKCNELAR